MSKTPILPFDARDGLIWLDGALVPWAQARLHVGIAVKADLAGKTQHRWGRNATPFGEGRHRFKAGHRIVTKQSLGELAFRCGQCIGFLRDLFGDRWLCSLLLHIQRRDFPGYAIRMEWPNTRKVRLCIVRARFTLSDIQIQ